MYYPGYSSILTIIPVFVALLLSVSYLSTLLELLNVVKETSILNLFKNCPESDCIRNTEMNFRTLFF